MTKITVFFLIVTVSSCFAKFDMERDNLEDAIPKGMTRQKMQLLKQKNAKDYATELRDRLVHGKLGSKDSINILADHPLYKIEEQRVNGQGIAAPMKQLIENPLSKNTKKAGVIAISNLNKHRRNNADYIGTKTNLLSSITNHINEDNNTDLDNFTELDIQEHKITSLFNNGVVIPTITAPSYF